MHVITGIGLGLVIIDTSIRINPCREHGLVQHGEP